MTATPERPAGRRGPGRPPVLTADAIARAVLDLGFPGLTFAAVAERLGVGQATLYRHASNRDELVRLGLDLALREHEWPDLDGPWRPLLERWAIASWRAWEKYPGAVRETGDAALPPSIVELTDRVGRALVARGFIPRSAVLAVDLVFDLVADSKRGAETFDAIAEDEEEGLRDLMAHHWEERVGDEDSLTLHLRAEMLRAIHAEPFDWFRGKLRVVLAGIAEELAPEGDQENRKHDA